MRIVACLLLLAALVAACDDELPDERDRPLEADLHVTVRPKGPDGPARERRIECAVLGRHAPDPTCRRLGSLRPEQFEPVPERTACTAVFGGPATARVVGTLRGERVEASFSLRDGCEIARWRRNADLLGPPPGGAPTP